ncbi:AGE family epimerase/isomerase [Bacteroidota bacterium]
MANIKGIKVDKFCIELKGELSNILNYWMKDMRDEERGGYYGRRDHFNQLIDKAPKGAVLNARILWTFSAAFRETKEPVYKEYAEIAYQFMLNHFIDKEFGGIVWEVDYLGNPSNYRKQIYAQGFAIYGFSEYYRITGKDEALRHAIKLFTLIEEHSYDPLNGGYIEALDRDWSHLEDVRLSEKDDNLPKSMNTHLHILEPYTNLYRVWKDERLERQIQGLIRVFLDHIINSGTAHFNLFFDMDWTVRSTMVSYGHDIEGTWLLTEAADELDDLGLLEEVKAIAIRMTDTTIAEGLDEDGAIYYEKEGQHLDSDKHWWPQAEAMVGYVNAWQITFNHDYLDLAIIAWQFIKKRIIDKNNGEWFWRVDRSGNPIDSEDKAGFWKCPYHNSRACIEIINRLNKS